MHPAGPPQSLSAQLPSIIANDGAILRKIVDSDMTNLRPATFYAAANALENFLDVLRSSDQYQDALKLGSTFNVFPVIRSMLELFQSVRSGNVGGSVLRLLDLYSEVELQRQFNWKPGMGNVKDFIRNYAQIQRRLKGQGIWGPQIMYGRFDYDLPYDVPSGDVHMTVHSKVKVSFEDTTLLSIIFKSDAIGMLPSLSNVWACIPFSFVVNWFTNEGRRFKDIDDQLILLLLPLHYCVHSLTITSEWSSEYLSSLHLSTIGGKDVIPKTVYYQRWVSCILPILQHSKYDFRAADPSHIPLRTAGCLAWSLLRG